MDNLCENYKEYSPYIFCNSNPIIYLDNDGDSPTLATGGIGATIGGLVGVVIEI